MTNNFLIKIGAHINEFYENEAPFSNRINYIFAKHPALRSKIYEGLFLRGEYSAILKEYGPIAILDFRTSIQRNDI
jgi:hypothetical protein